MVQNSTSEISNSTTGVDSNDQDMLKFLAHAALARTDLLAYNTFIDTSYELYPGLEQLINHLQQVESGEIKRLIITMPPRHGKSETTSGKFPGWCIGRDPTRTVIMTSYSATLAETFSVQNRDTISTNPRWKFVFPNITLDPNKRGKDKWAVTGRRESVIAAGVGGAITGFGAWLLLIDDPVKNAEEANSPAYQEKVYDWYRTTSRTRLTPDGRIIIIMTRWSEGDLVAKLESSEEWDQYTVLHLPALSYGTEDELRAECATEEEYQKQKAQLPVTAFPDRLNRPKGTPLWEDRFNAEFLYDAKIAMRHDFEALYQGNPSAPEGQKFKKDWFRGVSLKTLASLPIKPVVRVRSWDLAWSSKTSADFTVGIRATMYVTDDTGSDTTITPKELQEKYELKLPPAFIVLDDLIRYQKEWDASEQMIKNTMVSDGYKTEVLIEAVASQNIAVKTILKEKLFWRHRVIPIIPTRDKEERAKYSMQLASKGLVFIAYPDARVPPAWENEFLRELGAFPNAAKDDQVDAFTQLINHWAPRIDKLLLKMAQIEWATPFDDGKPKDKQNLHLPAPFREGPDPHGSPARDHLSWV